MLNTPTKKGFIIQITTYENDGDNLITKTIYGLSENNMNFLYETLKKVREYQFNDIPCSEELIIQLLRQNFERFKPDDELQASLLSLIEYYDNEREEDKKEGLVENDARIWLQEELLDYPSSEDYPEDYIRQLDSVEIYFLKEPAITLDKKIALLKYDNGKLLNPNIFDDV